MKYRIGLGPPCPGAIPAAATALYPLKKEHFIAVLPVVLFTAKEHDPNTGLIYFGARYYDPDIGRFITQDSYLGEPGTPPSLNRYLYAYSNPTVYIDLLGYESILPYLKDKLPYDAHLWGHGEFTDEAGRFADELSEEESGYIGHFQLERIDPENLTKQQVKRARELFGDQEAANELYANWKDRAGIIEHYKWSHPGTINLLTTHYRVARDLNPIHFAFERGWQVGSGEEMFTGEKVNRWRSGAEFLAAIALVKGTQKVMESIRPKITTEAGNASAKGSSSLRGEEGNPARPLPPKDNYSPEWQHFYRDNPTHPEARVRSVGAAGNEEIGPLRSRAPNLPEYKNGGKTQGVLRVGKEDIPLLSGYEGPSQNMPKGTPGMHHRVKSHVEAHAAAIMRERGICEAQLFINRTPCPGKTGCDAMLSRMLPEGAKLRIIGPEGFDKTYVGIPD